MRASATARRNRAELESVRGQIAFARRSPKEREPEFVVAGYDNQMAIHDVSIRNARPIEAKLSLDREGFALVQQKISWANERDREVLRQLLEEMVPFIKDYFTASCVVPRHERVVVRSVSALDPTRWPYDKTALVQSRVAGFAHCDYAPLAGLMLAALNDQDLGLRTRSYSRLMIIQTWRALSPPPHDCPLAFCDTRSIVDIDLVEGVDDRYGVKHRFGYSIIAHSNFGTAFRI
ncbi:CmcJ/NvfI family oxidoreductase [Bradyrhizobium pachyrhizi]|uniref:CmcJ/NvfI family oxidoreductase n=1 Tax=Bradyrhizobium pachyrhizi TaxID=280333 RepID=UPI000AA68351|nr:CmcJ/NvfI family oxidoreductase [Bradyrhizobium pachyrhizi]